MRMLDFLRSDRASVTWQDEALRKAKLRSCACPVARSCGRPRAGSCCARSGSAASSRREKRSTCSVIGGARQDSVLPYTGASEGLGTLVVESDRACVAGRQAPRAGSRASSASPPASPAPARQPHRRAGAQVRGAPSDALPSGSTSRTPSDGRHVVRLGEDREVAARARDPRPQHGLQHLPVRQPHQGLRGAQKRLLRRRAPGGAAVQHRARGRRRQRQLGRARARRLARARRRARDSDAAAARTSEQSRATSCGLEHYSITVRERRARSRDWHGSRQRPSRSRHPPRAGSDHMRLVLFLFLGAQAVRRLSSASAVDRDRTARPSATRTRTRSACTRTSVRHLSRPATCAAGSTKRCATAVTRARWPSSSSTSISARRSGRCAD